MWLHKTGVLGLCIGVFVMPFLASAHATPVSYTPVAGATELKTPSSISIRFTERIEMGASSLTVFGPNGEEVNEGKGVLDATDQRVLMVPITDAGNGVYAISWQVVSVDDGHFTKGAFSFLVDPEGKVFEGSKEGVEITYSSKLPEAVLGFLNLLGESIYIALLTFIAFVCKPLYRRKEVSQQHLQMIEKIFVHLALVGTILFTAGSAITFARKSAELSLLQGSSFLEASLVYLGSSVGTFLAFKVFGILLLCLILGLFMKKLLTDSGHKLLMLAATILGGVLYMQAYVSHAAASFFLPNVSVSITFLHLLAKEFIIGGVAVLCVLLLVFSKKKSTDVYRRISAHFDLFASLGLFFAGLTGVYITWLHLKHLENMFVTEWGTRFIALLLATCILGGFRLFHQFVLHPRLKSPQKQKVLSVTLAGELMAGLLVLFISGYISITTPPFTVEEYAFLQGATSEGVMIHFEIHPLEHSMFRLSLRDELTQEPVDADAITITATNEERSIGPNVVEAHKRAPGTYVFPVTAFSPAGNWELSVIAGQKEGYDAHAAFVVAYPDDVATSKRSDDIRAFDSFGVVMIGIGIGLLLFSSALVLHAWLRVRKLATEEAIGDADLETAGLWICRAVCVLAILGIFIALIYTVGQTPFERECRSDGHQWRQAFPARDFEAASPNALNGCTVHEGHYHFVDYEEYKEFKKNHSKQGGL
jgi:methionine-rich copper-binding protein CopC